MADNAQKTPLARQLNQLAEKTAHDALQRTGRGLPCSVVSASGSIVTVKFEVSSAFTLPNVTVPMFGPEWIRYPMQAGEPGIVVPVDAHISGLAGLGGGIASLTQPANLSSLVFIPIGNKGWTGGDPNKTVLYGPDGVILRDKNTQVGLTLDAATGAVLTLPNEQYLTITKLPTAPGPSGTLWRNGNVVNVVP